MRGLVVSLLLASAGYAQDRESVRKAVQNELDFEKPACVALFDANDPTGHLQLKKFAGRGLPPRLQVYYDHGLVTKEETHVQLVNGVMGSRGKNAWRFDWAAQVSKDVVNDELCYGYQPQVSEILRYKTVAGGQLSVEYTCRYGRVADWAKEAWVREKEPVVAEAQREHKVDRIIELGSIKGMAR